MRRKNEATSHMRQSSLQRIAVDFNTLMSEPIGWVKLGEVGTPNGDRLPPLQDGERVMLWEEGLEVEATVSYDRASGFWLAQPDETSWHDLPLSPAPESANPTNNS